MNDETSVTPETKLVQRAINSACRVLAIREHSQKQLIEKLRKKGFVDSDIHQAVNYLIKENWLSETRFCDSYIRSKVAKGQGKVRIEMSLQRHGVAAELIARSFAEQEIDWAALCLEIALKKIRIMGDTGYNQCTSSSERLESDNDWTYEEQTQRRLKLERFLRYRGFALDDIKNTITKCLNSRSPKK